MDFEQLLTIVSSENPPQLSFDSRKVKDGDVFIAIKGTCFDGNDFIGQAISNGAGYIVTEKPIENKDSNIIQVENSAQAAAILAQKANGNPASKLTNLAVTGTNGKTTVAFLVHSIIQNTNQKCGLISTIVYDTGEQIFPAEMTTPDCITIAEKQKQMVTAGEKYMVIEASSHALVQSRLSEINFKAAAFTNLTGDHLDYHKNKENYLAAKSLLFENLTDNAIAVLNKESPQSLSIAKKTNAEILYYGIDCPADITADIKSMDINGSIFFLKYNQQQQQIKTLLPGKHNISNCLAAAGLCIAAEFDLKQIADGIEALKIIPGRLEKIEGNDFSVIIDYAHTDDALKNVLNALRPLCKEKLILVFGCGGDRDRSKRPRMAKVAEQLADIVIVTSDNPRSEHPAAILGEIATGFDNPESELLIFEIDRDRAIEVAIRKAQKNDIVLIAGKGHETFQIVGDEKIHFNDKEIAEQILNEIK